MYATFSRRGVSPSASAAPTSQSQRHSACRCGRNDATYAPDGEISGRRDGCYLAEIKATSIFGIKFCHSFAKTPKNEGMCVDVVENKRTKIVTSGVFVDVAENKGRSERDGDLALDTDENKALRRQGRGVGRNADARIGATVAAQRPASD